VIADKSQQRPFIRLMRADSQWQMRYEDEQAILFVKTPPETVPRTPSAQPNSSTTSQSPEELSEQ
jgi:hypothetical protein